jgi:predicted membrane protein
LPGSITTGFHFLKEERERDKFLKILNLFFFCPAVFNAHSLIYFFFSTIFLFLPAKILVPALTKTGDTVADNFRSLLIVT